MVWRFSFKSDFYNIASAQYFLPSLRSENPFHYEAVQIFCMFFINHTLGCTWSIGKDNSIISRSERDLHM